MILNLLMGHDKSLSGVSLILSPLEQMTITRALQSLVEDETAPSLDRKHADTMLEEIRERYEELKGGEL